MHRAIRRLPVAPLLAAALSAGCASSGAANGPDASTLSIPDAPTPTPPAPGTPTEAAVQDNTDFAFDLHTKLRSKPGNLFFSPSSISTALAMTYAGARGETAAQMAKTLHFSRPPAELHAAFQALQARWVGAGAAASTSADAPAPPELKIANRLFAQSGFGIEPDFVSLTRDRYAAPIEQLDFQKQAEPSRLAINGWVSGATKDKIKDLIKPGMIDASTRLVLTNATYFKAAWAHPFSESQTKPEPFFASPAASHPVPMMHETFRASYAEVDGAQVIELPYVTNDPDRRWSMVIALPSAKDGLPALEAKASRAALARWTSAMKHEEVAVALPRFKVTSEFELSKTLAEMGMPAAFSDAADFSGISREAPLKISNVVHQAFVDVNERGTEAAAATAVMMAEAGMAAPSTPKQFRADHPFLIFLRDMTTGGVLFVGRIADPPSS